VSEPKVSIVKLSELKPDARNANKGTERGRYMVEQSLGEVGAGRSIVADKNGVVPAGNKTLEAAFEVGFEEALVVESDGKRLVVVKRTDWDLEDGDPNNPARRYAYWDNRAGEAGLAWDGEVLAGDLDAGFDFSALFQDAELVEIIEGAIIDPLTLEDEGDDGEGSDMTAYSCPKCGFTFHVES